MNEVNLPIQAPLIKIDPQLENLQLPAPELIQYYRLYEDRRIYIDYDIDDSLIEVSKQIMQYNRDDRAIPVEKRTPIYIYIYTYGGDLAAAYSLIAICESSLTPIITVNMGLSMSAGLLILLAGHKRYCLKRSQALIHQGSGGCQGSFSEMEESQKMYRKTIEEMKRYILEKTNIDEKTFNKNKNKDWYLTDQEQISYGIVDGIVNSIDQII